jgi:3-keto-5-aminohexanoate cleavage enzyme
MSWQYSDPYEYLKRQSGKMDPLIITASITGGFQGKEIIPNLPETPEEQAAEAARCYNAGASICHIHARDAASGYVQASGSVEVYRNIFRLIRKNCPDMIVSISGGGGVNLDTPEKRMEPIGSLPDMGDIDMGPIAFSLTLKQREHPLSGRDADVTLDDVVAVTMGELEEKARRMTAQHVVPEFAIFHSGQWSNLQYLINKGVIKPPYVAQILLGGQGGDLPTPGVLLNNINLAPRGTVLSVGTIGRHETATVTMGIVMGLNVIVGMENNIYYSRGKLLESSAQSVERVVRIARELGRPIATPQQAREMLGIGAPRSYE